MTSIRRRLLDDGGGAVLIACFSLVACQSPTPTEQGGNLSREDTIAFLVLSDQLSQFRNEPGATILCVSVGTSDQFQSEHSDPSNALMARLQETNRPGTSNIVLKRRSDCEINGSEWADKRSGRRAYIVFSSAARESEFVSKDCGQYLGGWHGGSLDAGGNYYAVDEESETISITRTNCRFAS